MRTLSPDTSPEAEAVLIDLARNMSPRRKLEVAFSMTETVRQVALAGLRSRHSGATAEEPRRRLAALLLPGELASAAYGWDAARDGRWKRPSESAMPCEGWVCRFISAAP